MVISAADGGPEDGRNESQGLPIDPGSWQDQVDDQVNSAADHVSELGAGAAAAEVSQVIRSAFEATPQTDRLALGDEERLPWLESADDVDYDEPGSDSGRMVGFVIFAVLLLFALVGGIFWATRHNSAPAAADGSLIAASKEPYKVAPKDPGGKTFEGTGDASFKVSEGEKPAANLAGSAAPGAPAAKPVAPVAAPAAVTAPTSGVGVQVGAFSTNAAAEAAWSKLAAAHAPLAGMSHRVVEGKADMTTVFRLQAVAGDLAAANALCSKLSAGGLKCQVKR